MLAEEKLLRPNAARAGVIVVAGDDQHRDFQRADGGAGCGNGRFGGVGRIEHIAGDQDEGGVRGLGEIRESLNGLKSFLLKAVPLCVVADRGKRFAKLPVSGVQKNETHGGFLSNGVIL